VALGGTVVAGGQLRASANLRSSVRLRQVIAEKGLNDYRLDEYEAMRDDGPRTSKYAAAIGRRLAGLEGRATVVDIGTGPFALLAIIAARSGARRVYAIEKIAAVAALAREAVASAGLEEQIEVMEGDSLNVKLPERVDFVVSEIIGSIAKQEGVQRIIQDARERFLKADNDMDVARPRMIPARCQTYIAPVSYAYHSFFRAKPETLRPLRLDSESRDIAFLAEAALLEDFDFCEAGSGSARTETKQFAFRVPAEMAGAASGFSGFAMWCRVVMDEVDIIEVRGQRSHWAYVVALMAPQPMAIAAPSEIRLESRIDPTADPVSYVFEAEVILA